MAMVAGLRCINHQYRRLVTAATTAVVPRELATVDQLCAFGGLRTLDLSAAAAADRINPEVLVHLPNALPDLTHFVLCGWRWQQSLPPAPLLPAFLPTPFFPASPSSPASVLPAHPRPPWARTPPPPPPPTHTHTHMYTTPTSHAPSGFERAHTLTNGTFADRSCALLRESSLLAVTRAHITDDMMALDVNANDVPAQGMRQMLR